MEAPIPISQAYTVNRIFQKWYTLPPSKFLHLRCILHEFYQRIKPNYLPNILHVAFWIPSKLSAAPFDIEFDTAGYIKLRKKCGARSVINAVLYIHMVINTLFITSAAFHDDFRISVKGKFTLDFMVYSFVLCIRWSAVHNCVKIFRDKDEIAEGYNACTEAVNDFTGAYLGGKHILQLFQDEPHVKLMCWMLFLASMSGFAIVPLGAFGLFRNSPMVLTFYVRQAAPNTWAGSMLVFCFRLNDMLFISTGGYVTLTAFCLVCEQLLEGLLFLRALRTMRIPYYKKSLYYTQMDLMVTVTNGLFAAAAPLYFVGVFYGAVTPLVLLVKMGSMHIPLQLVLPLGCALVLSLVMATIAGFCVLRQCEAFRNESLCLASELERLAALEVNTYWKLVGIKKRVHRRCFRKRPLGFRMGMFMMIESGMGIGFILGVLQNAISCIFMVDARHPLMIL